MKKYLSILVLLSIVLNIFNSVKAADIDLVVSPIKYEIQANPGATVTKTAKLINKTSDSMLIRTWKSDFVSNDNSWNPSFVRKSELVNPDQELASWITINTDSFNIWANEEKDIEFTINIPVDATPGWHYWAVFFKNFWSDNVSAWWQIDINIDYWVLLLVNVDWEVIDNGEPGDPIITNTSGGWGYSWTEYLKDNPTYESEQEERHLDWAGRFSVDRDWGTAGIYQFYGTSRDPSLSLAKTSSGEEVWAPHYPLVHQTGLDVNVKFAEVVYKLELIGREGQGGSYFLASIAGVEFPLKNLLPSNYPLNLLFEYHWGNNGSGAATPFDNDAFAGFILGLPTKNSSNFIYGIVYDVDTGANTPLLAAAYNINEKLSALLEYRAVVGAPSNHALYSLRNEDFLQLELNYKL